MRKVVTIAVINPGSLPSEVIEEEARCSKCACWDYDSGSLNTYGECRRFPKVVKTNPDDHCWEFRACELED
jgi:hypothetical protein